MFIKQVVIKGFKSFQEQSVTMDFSPKLNCVVGANGSGKTNFFHAIRFVLSDLSQNLCSEDRHALLHEGAGRPVLSAFVEIVFDNSDKRIPVDKEEVHLRRTISLKKDEYYQDGKHITKTEVMNLLENARISHSNPYYVVQQGKIAYLALMKDSERLDLLKEIGGVKIYEERRLNSLKIMQDTGNKREQIVQVVQRIDKWLKELDEEKEELRKYQDLDKQKKFWEYVIFNKEVNSAHLKLEETEQARTNVSERLAKKYNEVLDEQEKSKDLENNLKDKRKEHENLIKEKEVIQKRKTAAFEKHTKLEFDVKDLEEKISVNAKEEATKELAILKDTIKDLMDKLKAASSLYDIQAQKEKDINKRIMECDKKLHTLYRKKQQGTKFSSKAARDKLLQKETGDLERALSSNKTQEEKLIKEIQQLKDEMHGCNEYIQSCKRNITDWESLIAKSHEGLSDSKEERNSLQDTRKSVWSEESVLTGDIDKLKSEVEKAQQCLDRAIPGDVRRGLNSVQKICKTQNISGVFGPIIELLKCDEKFFTAVEVTAGNRLFHVVVDNDDTSTKIIKHLNQQKGGRVTFIPLNRVNAPKVLDLKGDDFIIPLFEKLQFREDCAQAFKQVFARTVICKNLDVASEVARTKGLDCITLEGDQVSQKGSLTGGFYDHKQSRLKFMSTIKQNAVSIVIKEKRLKQVKIELQQIDQKMNEFVTETQKVDAQCADYKSKLEELKQDIANHNKQKLSFSNALLKKEKSLEDVRDQIKHLTGCITEKKAEMDTVFTDHLTEEENKLLSDLNKQMKILKVNLDASMTECIESKENKVKLETKLTSNLKRKEQDLEDMISSYDTMVADAKSKRQELSDAKILLDNASSELKRVDESINNQNRQIAKINDEINKLKSAKDQRYQEEAKKLEQLVGRINEFAAKKEKYTKKIKELGPLTSDAFMLHDRFKTTSMKDLQKMLLRCNDELQQFSHVNKNAFDQHINFTEERERLQKKLAELDAKDKKIRELIASLDQMKDESINHTFNSVAGHFQEVFSKLVQRGHGHLVLMMKDGDHDDDDDQGEDGPREANPKGRAEKYIGVKVKVSFPGHGETQSMKQLSGGQKTVVALALIFAIQRCDPAPFYIFDEVDAALDTQYRTAVGNMIRHLADIANTQFIMTTFRPELVKVADKIYGVTHKNGGSRVDVISENNALEFINQDHTQNAE